MLNKEKTITISLDEYNRLLKSQKQVDELKEQLLIAKLQGLTEGYLDGVQAERNAQIIKPTIVELPKEITQKIKEQAGQSTAKEIFTDLLKEFSIRKSCGNADVVVREMASRKGVEVE